VTVGEGAHGPLVDAAGADAGVITRAARGRGFAFVRRGAWEPGTRLSASGVPVEVAS